MSEKARRPTIEQIKMLEEYLNCKCAICKRVVMLSDIHDAFVGVAMMMINHTEDFNDYMEILELRSCAKKLIDFHVASHLQNDFGLTVKQAGSVIEYKARRAQEEQDSEDIPF